MLSNMRDWRRRWRLRQNQLNNDQWQATLRGLPVLRFLNPEQQYRLEQLVTLFLAEKSFVGRGGLDIDDNIQLWISAQACLPVLELGLDYYQDWSTIIVYPDSFIRPQPYRDQAGIVHDLHSPLAGEAWPRGPLVLSWQDVLYNGQGYNVVIHECAHKLDMLNGGWVNGFPPLHADMDRAWWPRVFAAAYDDFCGQLEQGSQTAIDAYAAESPGEFSTLR